MQTLRVMASPGTLLSDVQVMLPVQIGPRGWLSRLLWPLVRYKVTSIIGQGGGASVTWTEVSFPLVGTTYVATMWDPSLSPSFTAGSGGQDGLATQGRPQEHKDRVHEAGDSDQQGDTR